MTRIICSCFHSKFFNFSPSEGPCCSSETCRFVPLHYGQQCRSESDCSWSSLCNGTSPECPSPQAKANKTRCNEGIIISSNKIRLFENFPISLTHVFSRHSIVHKRRLHWINLPGVELNRMFPDESHHSEY